MIQVQWRPSSPRIAQVLPIKSNGHGDMCPACDQRLIGSRTVLLVIGPGADPVAQDRHKMGGWYSAVAIEVHASCAGVQ